MASCVKWWKIAATFQCEALEWNSASNQPHVSLVPRYVPFESIKIPLMTHFLQLTAKYITSKIIFSPNLLLIKFLNVTAFTTVFNFNFNPDDNLIILSRYGLMFRNSIRSLRPRNCQNNLHLQIFMSRLSNFTQNMTI